jgi:hypothetical protein
VPTAALSAVLPTSGFNQPCELFDTRFELQLETIDFRYWHNADVTRCRLLVRS